MKKLNKTTWTVGAGEQGYCFTRKNKDLPPAFKRLGSIIVSRLGKDGLKASLVTTFPIPTSIRANILSEFGRVVVDS
jgi:hypothetical protein